MEKHNWKVMLIAVFFFAVAMAFLESAVVVYLRALYYPEGFSFPLKMMPSNILIVEVFREAATIVMLLTVAWMAGRGFMGRFALFVFAFSIWDIFYYVFLKLTLTWPASFLEWDILFLIPIPWIAPALAPIIVSVCLIAASVIILQRESTGNFVKILPLQWGLFILGGLIVIVSFLLNTASIMHQTSPVSYNWYVFAVGVLTGLATFVTIIRK